MEGAQAHPHRRKVRLLFFFFFFQIFNLSHPSLQKINISSVNKIVEEFNKFVKNHQGLTDVNKTDAKGKSLRDVGALIRAAPQYTEQLSKFSLHLNLSQAAMSKYTNDKIEDLARMEQVSPADSTFAIRR